ncbi:putative arginine/ornithine antiporter [Actinobacillus equuli]|nr:putative arginine/ornithine antiporter [Actinobacillus equuli]
MLIQLSTTMILVPYFLVGAYLFKVAMKQNEAWYIKLTGAMASIYGLWIVYAAGLDYLLLSVVLYMPGVLLFFHARYKNTGKLQLTKSELLLLAIILLLFVGAIYTLITQ